MMTTKLRVRYMEMADIPQVMDIDYVSFKPPWPERSYRFELTQSQVSHMLVLEQLEQHAVQGWRRWLNQFLGRENPLETISTIVAYGGLWQVVEEAHISTIATHPDYRRQKFGEVILASMVKRAIMLKAEYVVLEVRVSNDIAQALYKKYGFEVHGIKRNYYHHDKEDAYDMRLILTDDSIAVVNQLYDRLCAKLNFRNVYSNTPHPRLGK